MNNSNSIEWPTLYLAGKSDILSVWQAYWDDAIKGENQETQIKYKAFSLWYQGLYQKVQAEARDHKQKNFQLKNRVIRAMFAGLLLQLLATVAYLLWCAFGSAVVQADILLAVEAAALLSVILLMIPFGKQLDIYKHQETWSRHKVHQERMEYEMMKYIFVLKNEDYHSTESAEQQFIMAVLERELQSAEKFGELMQTQEKEMLSEITGLK